jgi:hypothetical protein
MRKSRMTRQSFVSRVGVAASLAATFVLAAAASASAGTLDQQQTEWDNSVGLVTFQNPAQTFTAGMSGGLDQADLLLCCKDGSPTEPLTVEIRNTSGGEPGSEVLASASIPMSAVGVADTFVPATFAPPAVVTAGTQYALVVYTEHPTNDCCGWDYQKATDPYSGGVGFVTAEHPPAPPWDSHGGGDDFAFKTYVGPLPPPPVMPSTPPTTAPITQHKKKCRKKRHRRSAESAKKKKCKRKKR